MALTDGDKAECKEIAREIIKEVLAIHIVSCPHGIKMIKERAVLVGICIGSGLGSGGVVYALMSIFAGK